MPAALACSLTYQEISMAGSTTQDKAWSFGRSFASMDPERQCEVVGYVRSIEVTAPARATPERTVRSSRLDWARVQVDRSSNFEGGSNRRGR
jgi:hypothetical protein